MPKRNRRLQAVPRASRSVLEAGSKKLEAAYEGTSKALSRALDYGAAHPAHLSLVAAGVGLGLGIALAGGLRKRDGLSETLAAAAGAIAARLL
jgi:hypothetical protein